MPSVSYLIKRIKNMSFKSMLERVEMVKTKTSKPKFLIFLDMVWCGFRYGAGYVDYDVIGFYKLNHAQRKTMLTRGINNKFVKQLNKKDYWHIFDNKNEFNSTFSKFVTRDWIYPVSENKEAVMEWLEKHEDFFAKPNNGQCGKGIKKISLKSLDVFLKKESEQDDSLKEENNKINPEMNKNLDELYKYLVENKLELLEAPIKQHEKMNELNPSSVNTIRIVTVMNESSEVTILAAFSRIGNGKHVDNFNSGGMTAKIDVSTGKILEEAVNKKGEIFDKHPTTCTKIKGFQIPNWSQAKEMVKEAAKLSTNVRYIGWDVAITIDGVTLVEGNQFPGHDIYQVAEKIKEGQLGVLPEFEKALKVNHNIRTNRYKHKRKIRI